MPGRERSTSLRRSRPWWPGGTAWRRRSSGPASASSPAARTCPRKGPGSGRRGRSPAAGRFGRQRRSFGSRCPRFGHAPPAPAERGGVGGIREPLEELPLVLRVAGGEEELAGGPGELVVVRVAVAVERDLLVGARLAVLVDGGHEEPPARLACLRYWAAASGKRRLNSGDEAHCASAATAAAVAEVFFGQTTWGSPWSGRTLDSYSRSLG
jgi:hypothetical protein